MKFIGISTGLNFVTRRFALMWAKEHLPEQEYNEIKKSYDLLLKWTTVFVLCCIPIIIAFLSLVFNSPFSTKAETAATPTGATGYVMARVDYDGNFYWTNDSKTYEYALKDYALVPENFEFGNKIKVFVNDAQKVITVTTDENVSTIRHIEVGVGTIGAILVPILLILGIYVPIAYRTFGKPWREFYRKFEGN